MNSCFFFIVEVNFIMVWLKLIDGVDVLMIFRVFLFVKIMMMCKLFGLLEFVLLVGCVI